MKAFWTIVLVIVLLGIAAGASRIVRPTSSATPGVPSTGGVMIGQ